MIRRPPRSTPFPTRRSSDLGAARLRHRHHPGGDHGHRQDRKSTRLNSSHTVISYAVFCLKKKKNTHIVISSFFFFFFFNDTATTEIYTFPYTTLFRSWRCSPSPPTPPGW